MKLTETVRVTADHIAKGDPTRPESCPISLAIRAQHPGATDVDVYNDFAMLAVASDAPFLSAPLPELAQKFVHDFDVEDEVGPIEFDLTWETEEEVKTS